MTENTKTGLRVMVVDDDPFVRDVAVMALGAQPGVTVEAYDGGAAALAAFDAFAPDLLLLDLMMPAMDGRAVWRAVTARGRPRLILLTGQDDDTTRAEATALGAEGLIAKPFDPTTLAASVLGIVDTARAARLEALTRKFAASLPATRAAVEHARGKLAVWSAPDAEALLAEAHRVAGVAPMFGFNDVGRAADRVEELTRAALADGGWRAERREVEAAVTGLIAAISAVK